MYAYTSICATDLRRYMNMNMTKQLNEKITQLSDTEQATIMGVADRMISERTNMIRLNEIVNSVKDAIDAITDPLWMEDNCPDHIRGWMDDIGWDISPSDVVTRMRDTDKSPADAVLDLKNDQIAFHIKIYASLMELKASKETI